METGKVFFVTKRDLAYKHRDTKFTHVQTEHLILNANQVHQADVIIYAADEGFKILKNRHGGQGVVNLPGFVHAVGVGRDDIAEHAAKNGIELSVYEVESVLNNMIANYSEIREAVLEFVDACIRRVVDQRPGGSG